MAFVREIPVDLTNGGDDDEIEFVGSAIFTCQRGTTNSSNTHDLKSLKKVERKRVQPEIGNDQALFASQLKYTLPSLEKIEAKAKNNFVNLDWNGFGSAVEKAPDMPRTPSPLSHGAEDGKERASKNAPTKSRPLEPRKRFQGDSISTPAKRARNNSFDCTLSQINGHGNDVGTDKANYDSYQASSVPRGRKPTEKELSHGGVIVLDPGDDLVQLIEISSKNWNSLSSRKSSRALDPTGLLIDLDDEEDRLFEEIDKLGLPQSPPPGRSETIREPRNQKINPPWIIQPSQEKGVMTLRPGDVVETTSCGFLIISMIMKNLQSDTVILRGYRLDRSKELNGMLPKKLNEVYLNLEIELDDHRPPMVQGMEEIHLSDVVRLKKLNTTNQNFPQASFRAQDGFHNDEDVLKFGPCCLRWKHSVKFLTARDRWHNKWTEQCVERIQERDPLQVKFPEHFVSANELRSQYRGKTIFGGSYDGYVRSGGRKSPITSTSRARSDKPIVHVIDDEIEVENVRRSVSVLEISERERNLPPSDQEWVDAHIGQQLKHSGSSPLNFIDLSGSSISTPPNNGSIKTSKEPASGAAAREKSIRLSGQKYTYGDCFCGAGGSTRGALMAGLKIVWGFDQNNHACSSWRLNFPDATVYEEVANEFILRGKYNDSLIVDILHLSPPCQVFSPAHTVQGKDDEMNLASLFACGMLLDVAKPRIVTLEQTFGIIYLPRFKLYFNALILMFTDRGFSVRWTVARLQNWGLPQRRLRLVIFGSCPGEELPEFPPYTHGPPDNREGLRPWRSVRDAIKDIPRNAPNHDIDVVEAKRLNCKPWSDASIAPRCITTHGGQNYHPSGKRGFTYREYACLQGFPMNHKFGSVNVMKQIGNAVPPRVAKVLFSCIRKALEKADGLQQENIESEILQAANFEAEVIPID